MTYTYGNISLNLIPALILPDVFEVFTSAEYSFGNSLSVYM